MKRRPLTVGLVLLCLASPLDAQISPGDLSAAHAALEGIDKCTSCHALGHTVENAKCLACHSELKARIDARRGFHAPLQSKQCIECHKEHHGREFTLIRLEERSFDHSAVGFPLRGKHAAAGCRSCHKPEFLRDADVVRSTSIRAARTFLGLSRECVGCHTDPHAGRLTGPCTTCHGFTAWKPAPGFTHERTRFPLSGKHAAVRCESCHAKRLPEGIRMTYTGLSFGACSDCHADPHRGKLQGACSGCHTTADWRTAGKSFDHAKTRFPLKGMHQRVACFNCHRGAKEGKSDAGRFAVAQFARCSDCHANPHGAQFASRRDRGECSSCHSEQGWKGGVLAAFDHGTTKFPLKGKHANVACAICHSEKRQLPPGISRINLRTSGNCADCHADAHRGQFAGRKDGGRCESCHVETGFRPSTYTLNRHPEARFSLSGAHEAVPCDRCHLLTTVAGSSLRMFRWETTPSCANCHRDVHQGRFPMRTGEGCAACHTPRAWNALAYDHDRTKFPLVGKHRTTPCSGCHTVKTEPTKWRFSETPTACADCHAGRTMKL